MRRLKIFLTVLLTLTVSSILLLGCKDMSSSTGSVSLDITDAPISDASNIEGVYITITSIAYNLDGEWVTDASFDGPATFNLLDLTGGVVASLSDTTIEAGHVSQIRFMLEAPERGEAAPSNPGCYIMIDPDGIADGDSSDDTQVALFVPSGGQSGYKAVGAFDVPVNGTVEITADFDVRKSLVKTNSGYLLKPTIKLVVNNEAGKISGSFVDNTSDAYNAYSVFAYEDDTYSLTEATAGSETAPFQNAIGSAKVCDSDDDGNLDTYMIAFLAEGTYDLIVAGVDASGDYTVLSTTDYVDVAVTANTTSSQNIDLTP